MTIMPHVYSRIRLNTKPLSIFIIGQILAVLFLNGSLIAIARGYATEDSKLQVGMVATLNIDSSSEPRVERATQNSSNRVVGIVTTIESSLVTVSSGDAKVLVESEGQVDAYVSDINGEVNQGDTLVISPLKGILMKADGNTASTVIAIAATSPTTGSIYAYEESGQKKEVKIFKLSVNLNYQGNYKDSSYSDSALARLGRSIVGKDVGEIRVLIALIIFILVLITEGGIIYGAVSSAITALGRNPLARQIIKKELVQIMLIAVTVLVVGLGAVYAILWV